MDAQQHTYWTCDLCDQDYNDEESAEECCSEKVNADGMSQAELERLGQQRLIGA